MIVNILPPRLHDVLKAIHDFTEEFGKPPYRNNKWLSEQTGYEGNHLTNIKGELKKLGYLTDDLDLTSRGQQYVRVHFGAFAVRGVEVRVQGKVKASPGSDVLANYSDFDTPSDYTISIPSVSRDKDCFALRVDGPSMVAQGILPGDFVIVERQDSLWWPERQDMIIARYLPHNPDRNLQDNIFVEESIENADYVGPTLKIYLQRFGENGCELGWRTDNDHNPYVIKADHLIPLGKVIGVYRKIDSVLPLHLHTNT